MFESKTINVVMIGVGLILIAFGIWVPDSFLPPVVNLLLGIFTVISNSVQLGVLWNREFGEDS